MGGKLCPTPPEPHRGRCEPLWGSPPTPGGAPPALGGDGGVAGGDFFVPGGGGGGSGGAPPEAARYADGSGGQLQKRGETLKEQESAPRRFVVRGRSWRRTSWNLAVLGRNWRSPPKCSRDPEGTGETPPGTPRCAEMAEGLPPGAARSADGAGQCPPSVPRCSEGIEGTPPVFLQCPGEPLPAPPGLLELENGEIRRSLNGSLQPLSSRALLWRRHPSWRGC